MSAHISTQRDRIPAMHLSPAPARPGVARPLAADSAYPIPSTPAHQGGNPAAPARFSANPAGGPAIGAGTAQGGSGMARGQHLHALPAGYGAQHTSYAPYYHPTVTPAFYPAAPAPPAPRYLLVPGHLPPPPTPPAQRPQAFLPSPALTATSPDMPPREGRGVSPMDRPLGPRARRDSSPARVPPAELAAHAATYPAVPVIKVEVEDVDASDGGEEMDLDPSAAAAARTLALLSSLPSPDHRDHPRVAFAHPAAPATLSPDDRAGLARDALFSRARRRSSLLSLRRATPPPDCPCPDCAGPVPSPPGPRDAYLDPDAVATAEWGQLHPEGSAAQARTERRRREREEAREAREAELAAAALSHAGGDGPGHVRAKPHPPPALPPLPTPGLLASRRRRSHTPLPAPYRRPSVSAAAAKEGPEAPEGAAGALPTPAASAPASRRGSALPAARRSPSPSPAPAPRDRRSTTPRSTPAPDDRVRGSGAAGGGEEAELALDDATLEKLRGFDPQEWCARQGKRVPVVQWKGVPLPLPADTPFLPFLYPAEIALCATLRVWPAQYLLLKLAALRGATKAEAKRRGRMDVNKTGRMWDWCNAVGWVGAGAGKV